MSEVVAPELFLRGAASWQLLDESDDAVSVVDSDGKEQYANEACRSLLRLLSGAVGQSGQVPDCGTNDVMNAALGSHPWTPAVRRALNGEDVRESETRLALPSKGAICLRISAHPIRDSTGRIIGAMSIVRDISHVRFLEHQCATQQQVQDRSTVEIQRLVAAAEARAEELETIVNSIGDAVVITDEHSGATRWNPAYVRLLGAPDQGETSADRVRKFQFRDWDGNLVTPEALTAFRAVRDSADALGEYLITTQSGTEAYLRVHGSPLRDGEGNVRGAVIVIRDMTSERATDKQKDEFLSLVSHELRTPVTIIGGFTQVLRRSVEKADMRDMLRRLTIIERQVHQLTGLINELLDLSRVEHGRFECSMAPLDYDDLVRTVIDEMQQLNPTRSFVLALPADLEVMGDVIRLRQVLVNLLDNAVKHGPPQSTITVTVEANAGEVTTYVCDAGPPLPFSERHRVFDRFYRVAPGPVRNGGSLGLGLCICRSIVESHAGRIWVAEDDHSSFAFTLRRVPSAQNP